MKAKLLLLTLTVSCAGPVSRVNSGIANKSSDSQSQNDSPYADTSNPPAAVPAANPVAAPVASADSNPGSATGTIKTIESGSESITIPGRISGSLLECSVLSPATDENPTTGVGCRFGSKNGVRVALTAVAETILFDGVPPVGITMKIVSNPNSDWEVLYNFTALNAAESAAGADASKIIVHVIKPTESLPNDTVQVNLAEVNYPLLETWSPVCAGSACAELQIKANILWSPSLGKTIDWNTAVSKCSTLNYVGITGWRLPTLVEMQGAQAHQIFALAAANRLNLQKDTSFWSDTLFGVLEAYTINWFATADSSVTSQALTSDSQDILCVHQ